MRGTARRAVEPDAHARELLTAFHIGPEDLAANRAGRLGPRQAARLRRGVWSTLALTVVAVGVLVAIVLVVAHRPFTVAQLVVAAVVGVAGLAVGGTRAWRLRRGVEDGSVRCWAGPVRTGMRGRAGWWLSVRGESFHLPVRFWHVGSGLPYRVYVAPAPRLIVAMEPEMRVPFTEQAIAWEHAGDGEHPYRARVDGVELVVRVNDFPAEPLYSLLVDGRPAEDLDDWPACWTRPRTPEHLLRQAGAAQLRRGRMDAVVVADWAARLCRLPASPAGGAVQALGLPGTLVRGIGHHLLQPPPPGTDRWQVSEDHGDVFAVEVVPTGAGPSRAELDALLGSGADGVRVHPDQPHPVAYRVTVEGAPYTCDVFAYFAEPPTGATRSVRLMLRRQGI